MIGKKINGSYQEKVVVTQMDLEGLYTPIELPSGGDDVGYPGMCYHDGYIFVSYYSSHEWNQAKIYLSKIKKVNKNAHLLKSD